MLRVSLLLVMNLSSKQATCETVRRYAKEINEREMSLLRKTHRQLPLPYMAITPGYGNGQPLCVCVQSSICSST